MSRIVQGIEYSVLVLSLSIMCTITFINVLTRYLFGNSIAFTEEITVNLFVLMTFMGASVGLKRKAHLGFSLIFESLRSYSKLILTLFIGIVMGAIFTLLVYYGYEMVAFQKMLNQKTPALGWPQWVFSLGLPIGSLFCLYRVIEATSIEVKEILDEERGQQV
jgi:C4-dicarboxylate transporter DctQ subunit